MQGEPRIPQKVSRLRRLPHASQPDLTVSELDLRACYSRGTVSPEGADRLVRVRVEERPRELREFGGFRLDVLPTLQQALETQSKIQNLKSKIPQVAGMDSSDGLTDAIVQICRMSGVGARIERSQIPIPPALTHWVSSEQAMNWALYGGEDFELVLCLEPRVAQVLVEQLGSGAAIVGTITTEPEVLLVDTTDHNPDKALTLKKGFQHF